ncbi:hypothetical protein HFN96_15640 [Rhizobium laguerreae]|nr:hypothetical protein [Rhizobium laguerreae]MBY3352173.1 hypothetical protein [Rhizobium laguerreae]MBY3451165.1 hypothetical protein [Rhizobium laguerreae]MBY3458333.1 hypothetical protein [Rhizobium laguerreae]
MNADVAEETAPVLFGGAGFEQPVPGLVEIAHAEALHQAIGIMRIGKLALIGEKRRPRFVLSRLILSRLVLAVFPALALLLLARGGQAGAALSVRQNDGAAEFARQPQCRPFRRSRRKRPVPDREALVGGLFAVGDGDDGDRQPDVGMREQRQQRRKIRRHFENDGARADFGQGSSKVQRAGGAVVADREEEKPALARGQPLPVGEKVLTFRRCRCRLHSVEP